ncbi:phosphatase PAP2 family protein [Streptomyces sp. N35]|uniref:phosphatase PAP2 family protein n=1 Tax=Streptomyces sp. N35 TaxID=2795730 RepID=UPI0035ABE7CE
MTTARPTAPTEKPSLLARARTPRKPMLWFEIVLIAVSYWLYSLVRNAVPREKALALRHADWVWDTERRIGIGVEHAVNHAVNKVTWLIVGMNYYYATLHFIVTISVLVWLYRCHPGRYISGRLALFATTGIALIGFAFFPLAPPRLMEDAGFIDTVAVHHTWGSMSQGSAASVSNPYAAMPSMHIGWSTWCATMIACFARHPWVKALGILYPVATLLVIISTANHFWTDALGGLICLGFGFAVSYAWFGSFPWQLPRYIERRNPDPG